MNERFIWSRSGGCSRFECRWPGRILRVGYHLFVPDRLQRERDGERMSPIPYDDLPALVRGAERFKPNSIETMKMHPQWCLPMHLQPKR
jgi:hypothetical protein